MRLMCTLERTAAGGYVFWENCTQEVDVHGEREKSSWRVGLGRCKCMWKKIQLKNKNLNPSAN